MRPEDILALTPAGICCERGSFHIDPTRPVGRALITHAHSDHARAGHGAVLAAQETLDLMRLRYGQNFAGSTQAIRYGESVRLDGATVTLHPAGHVLGSAQFAVEAEGLRIVAFEALQYSTRHKSRLAMRFPRINRLRWDKPPAEADRLERLEKMVSQIEDGRAS